MPYALFHSIFTRWDLECLDWYCMIGSKSVIYASVLRKIYALLVHVEGDCLDCSGVCAIAGSRLYILKTEVK